MDSALEILVIGQSHLGAIRDAARARRASDPDAPRTRILHTLQPQFAPEIVGEGEGASLAPALAGEITARIARRRPLVVSAIGGNAHSMLALIRHPRPFDFRLDDAIDAAAPAIGPDVEPVPLALVTAALDRALAHDRLRLRLLSELLAGLASPLVHSPLVHLQSPPPVADDGWIAARAEAWFTTRGLAAAGVAPAPLRHRMWRLASRMVADTVTGLGGRVQPVPAVALDAGGYLNPDFAGDATHGNARYGEAVIAALEEGGGSF